MMRLINIRTASVLTCVLLWASMASASRTDLRSAPPIRNGQKLRSDRHYVTALAGFTMNDAYQRSLSLGLSYRYNFNNWLSVGVDLMGTYLTLDTDLTEQIESELSTPGNTATPSTGSPSFLFNAAVTFVPLYGKMNLLGLISVNYDVQIHVGVGYGTTRGTGRIDSGGSILPMWGLGSRIFFSDWIALEVGMRDYIMDMPVVAPANVVNPETEWVQNFMVTVGVSFFFPPDLDTEL